MENPVYHVLLEGRRVGPYDRRTIVGMRVKKTLTSDQVVLAGDGSRLTVGQLVRQDTPVPDPASLPEPASFSTSRSGDLSRSSSYSVVQAVHAAHLLEVEGRGYAVPPFKGELEVRVQTKVLRIAGRFRDGMAWKEDRVKLPLQDIAHARLRATVVDLWVRPPSGGGFQRLSLDLLTAEAAGELAESLPFAAPWPGSEPLAARPHAARSGVHPLLWLAVVGTAVTVGAVLIWVLTRRY